MAIPILLSIFTQCQFDMLPWWLAVYTVHFFLWF